MPELARLRRANSGWILGAFIKTFPGKSLTKMKGMDHIYLDKSAPQSTYVIKSNFCFMILWIFGVLSSWLKQRSDLYGSNGVWVFWMQVEIQPILPT